MANNAHITRRVALRGLAALPAAAMPVAAAAETEIEKCRQLGDIIAEPLGERIRRLAKELSAALDELNAPTYAADLGGDAVGVWMAHVWPKRVAQHVWLEQIDVPHGMLAVPAGQVRP